MRHFIAPTLVLLAAGTACASDGYFDDGYGIKAKGMAGAGVAFSQDAMAPATNPAGIATIGDRVDAGLTWFRPDRSASLGGQTYDANGTESFWIPEAGVRFGLNDRFALGLAVYGNGGMNTSYTTSIPAFGTSKAGVDLTQLFIAPTVSLALTKQHALGFSLVLAHQTFKATGLENFGITNQGSDDSQGAGFRIGYTGTITEWLSLGATYQSRTQMSRFDKYKGLFAEQGDFDIPANYAIGIAVTPRPGTSLAVDVERILFSSVAAIGNDVTMQRMMAGLGSDEGPGFGWKDVTVLKVGVSHALTPAVTVRAGYNYSTQPIPEDQTYFNMLAPGVVQQHVSLGGTWLATPAIELSAFYAHAFKQTVEGSGNIDLGGGPMDADLTMSQDSLGVGLGWLY